MNTSRAMEEAIWGYEQIGCSLHAQSGHRIIVGGPSAMFIAGISRSAAHRIVGWRTINDYAKLIIEIEIENSGIAAVSRRPQETEGEWETEGVRE